MDKHSLWAAYFAVTLADGSLIPSEKSQGVARNWAPKRDLTCSNTTLLVRGGNSNIFDVHSDPWGNDPMWL